MSHEQAEQGVLVVTLRCGSGHRQYRTAASKRDISEDEIGARFADSSCSHVVTSLRPLSLGPCGKPQEIEHVVSWRRSNH